jgi:hypothetical protein
MTPVTGPGCGFWPAAAQKDNVEKDRLATHTAKPLDLANFGAIRSIATASPEGFTPSSHFGHSFNKLIQSQVADPRKIEGNQQLLAKWN